MLRIQPDLIPHPQHRFPPRNRHLLLVQLLPHRGGVFERDVCWGAADAAVVRDVIPGDQMLQHSQIRQGVEGGEIPVEPLLQNPNKPLRHAGLRVPRHGKMVNLFRLAHFLHPAVVKFLAVVRLQSLRVAPLPEDFSQRHRHHLSRLILHWLHPRKLGKHIHHAQQIFHPFIGPH